jgi:hypothetical protein
LEGPVPSSLDVVAAPAWPRARIKSWVYGGAATLAVALILRYAVIEPHWIGIACGAEQVPWWCEVRQGIVWLHILWIWGGLGLLGGLLSITFGWLWALRLGFVMSLMGLVLYNADYGAVGLMLTLLRLPRT